MANILRQMPPVTRNLLIINCVVLLAQYVLEPSAFGRNGNDLLPFTQYFGLHFFLASDFYPWQCITYMFMHGGLTHLFFNMFALWMFGVVIENTLGQKRFLIYYFVCGLGAAVCQELWQLGQYYVEGLANFKGVNLIGYGRMTMDAYLNQWTTVGASGAVYGVLLAFGVLYPNQRLMLLIPPIPMKAKYFVFAYVVIELVSAFTTSGIVAHFAHLGGMLFGWLLLRLWRRQANNSQRGFQGWEHYTPSGQKAGLFERIKRKMAGGKPKVQQNPYARTETDEDYNLRKKQEEARLDEILDKIKASGYDSLTREEKEFLFQRSR